MRLNHPGIYRIIGESFELLANCVGEAPCIRITSALYMNDLIQRGKFTILEEESIEIQSIYADPDAFVFLEYEYSEICNLPPYRKTIRGTKMPNISKDEIKEFTERYLEDIKINGRGVMATKSYIMSKTEWSLSQINVVILQIQKILKRNGRLQFNQQSIYSLG